MRQTFKKILLLAAILTSFLIVPSFVFAQESNDAKLKRLGDEIAKYEQELVRLNAEANTLSNLIAQYNTQIKLTQLKISQTEEKIFLLGGRIEQLKDSLVALNTAYIQRVTKTYKMSRFSEGYLLFISLPNINDAINSFNYLKRLQEADISLLDRLERAQNLYEEEKSGQEALQKDLETQKASLSVQKNAKSHLLDQTRNDEKRYQLLLSQALAERAAIEKALISGVVVGPVKQGDPIALVGNSGYPGCSTGKHLHFEIRKDSVWTDPGAYLSNKSVIDEQNNNGSRVNIGSGGWPWPIQDDVRLTQFYGKTPYSWKYSYSGGIHTGYDMVSTSGDVIRAPLDGMLYKSAQSCGSSIINIVYIDHGNNLISFYLHVQ